MTNTTKAFIKETLAQKFADEQCGFTKRDITISGNDIIINGFEHIPMTMRFDSDDYFGYQVEIINSDYEIYEWACSKKEYPMKDVLLSLGYTIANQF